MIPLEQDAGFLFILLGEEGFPCHGMVLDTCSRCIYSGMPEDAPTEYPRWIFAEDVCKYGFKDGQSPWSGWNKLQRRPIVPCKVFQQDPSISIAEKLAGMELR